MTEEKQCTHCEKKLTKANKTGYCSDCFRANIDGVQAAYQRARRTGSGERLICKTEGCTTALRSDNQVGYCADCYYSNKNGCRTEVERTKRTGSEDWKDKLCENPECKAVLMSNNTRGVCSNCYNANYNHIKTKYEKAKTLGYLPDELRRCAAEGCDKVLYENNERGYCRSCWDKNADNARTKYQRLIYTGVVERSSCKGCEVELPLQNLSGYCSNCFNKNVDGIRSAVDRHPARKYKKRISNWKRQGIIFTDDDVVVYEESTHCQLCDKEFADNRQSMKCLDHDHETGDYRGTICGACNTGLGKLGDNLPEILERVFHYYVKYSRKKGQQPKLNLIR